MCLQSPLVGSQCDAADTGSSIPISPLRDVRGLPSACLPPGNHDDVAHCPVQANAAWVIGREGLSTLIYKLDCYPQPCGSSGEELCHTP